MGCSLEAPAVCGVENGHGVSADINIFNFRAQLKRTFLRFIFHYMACRKNYKASGFSFLRGVFPGKQAVGYEKRRDFSRLLVSTMQR